MGNVVTVDGLTKSYDAHPAVAGISFAVAEGEIVALLGPNGAGKTTTVEILEGLRRRDGGQVTVLGRDPQRRDRSLRIRVGVVPQFSGVDRELTVTETLRLYRSCFRGGRHVDDVLDDVGLTVCARKRLSTLSGGQLRRVDLAAALVGDPELLFLDEPTTGLDPAARHQTWAVIRALRARGVAVLLTSHYLEEVQRLADRVIMMRAGRIVADDTPDRIVGDDGGAVITFRISARTPLPPGPWTAPHTVNGVTTLETDDVTHAVLVLSRWATERSLELDELEIHRQTLEEKYLELTSGP